MKDLKFKFNNQVVSTQLESKIDKKSLYGFAKKIAERNGIQLSKGILCPDGFLLKRDELSTVYIDPEGTPVEEVITEIDGKPAALQPSSFDQENPLTSVPLKSLIGFNVSDVYPLLNVSLSPGLYQTQFSYRRSFQPKDAFILVKAEEAFLLVGQMKKTTFVGLTIAYEFFDAETSSGEESDELDFSMV